MNVNGVQDGGEPGIGGVLVTLLTCGNVAVASTSTNAAGFYLFSNLVPGCYKVQFTTPATFTPTTANAGGDALDSDSVGGITGNYNLASGETNLTVDAGFYKVAALGDFVWKDKNANGIQDAGEPGIPGVLVTLLRCDGTVVELDEHRCERQVPVQQPGAVLLQGDVRHADRLHGEPGQRRCQRCRRQRFGRRDDRQLRPGARRSEPHGGRGLLRVHADLHRRDVRLLVDQQLVGSGTKGNIRTFTAGGVSVNVSAWGRDKSSGSVRDGLPGPLQSGPGRDRR